MMNCPLHIGLVGPLPPPFGGMANQTRQLAELLRGEGLTVSLVQTNAAYRPNWISRLPFIRAIFRLVPYLFALWNLSGRCNLLHIMANSGWSWHLVAAPAIWIAKLRKTPVIVNYRGGEAASFLANSTQIVGLSMRQAAALIVPSGFLKAVFASFNMAAVIVPNIVDIARFNNPAPHRALRRHLLVARNLEPIYDNETAIRAFFVCSPQPSRCHANDSRFGSLGRIASHLGTILWASPMQSSFPAGSTGMPWRQAYREADIAINPSVVDNMPNSVLEAMASGVPVVSTNVGGVPFIVHDQDTALLVPPKSPDAMAGAILRLMEDAALSEKLVNNGLAEVQKYTWQRVWPILADVYGQHARQLPA